MLPEVSISPRPNGHTQLKINGSFTHPHWIAFLFSGLSAERISVVSGRAVQTAMQWEAHWNLDFSSSEKVPESLDYAAMALQRSARVGGAGGLELSRYQIARRRDQSLEVWLQGPDQIGFLGRVLSRLSLIMLFPIEIDINTSNGQIRDYIVFRGIGGLAPNEEVQKSLDILLKSCLTK